MTVQDLPQTPRFSPPEFNIRNGKLRYKLEKRMAIQLWPYLQRLSTIQILRLSINNRLF